MLCSECKKRNAVIFCKQNINGESAELALCPECAERHGLFSAVNLFSGLFDMSTPNNGVDTSKKCPTCGLSARDVLVSGKAGCPHCYEFFCKELAEPIRRIHGNVSHTGRAPSKFCKINDKKKKLEALKKSLGEAVAREEYENAAVIRDEIRALEAE